MTYDRRRFLQAAAIAAVGAGAGCSTETQTDTDAPPDEDDTPAPTSTPGATPASGDGGSGGSFDFGGWLAETSNYDGTTADVRGQSAVTIDVGVQANGGAFGFGPVAVHVDPGTTVTWEWTGEGGQHNVVAESGADFESGDPTNETSHTFEHTFESQGMVKYFCSPHRSLGMRGGVVVGDPDAANGTPTAGPEYGFQAATFDAYWYSLYNMSTNIAMSGNGVPFPLNAMLVLMLYSEYQ